MMSVVSRKPQPLDVPTATRLKSPGWRDPRLWVGVALVAGSVVAGSAVVGASDDTSAVWAAARNLSPGEVIEAEDLTSVRIRFADADAGEHYLATSRTLPEDLTVVRGLGEGELVPIAALGAQSATETVAVSVAVDPEHLPVGVGAGSRVDIWVVAERGGGALRAKPVLLDVGVIAAPSAAESFAATNERQLVIAVPRDDTSSLATLLAASGEGLVRVVGRR